MSNVLIGIIGVILFIGLALAGTLFLGDKFQSASNSSRASSHAARVQQVAAGAQLYQLVTGERIGTSRNNTGLDWLTPDYIKSLPSDFNSTSPQPFTYPTGSLIYSFLLDSRAKAICEEIQRKSNQVGPDDAPLAPMDLSVAQTRWPVGCVIHNTRYTVYAAI